MYSEELSSFFLLWDSQNPLLWMWQKETCQNKSRKLPILYSVYHPIAFIGFKAIFAFRKRECRTLCWDFKEGCSYKLVKWMSHLRRCVWWCYQPSITCKHLCRAEHPRIFCEPRNPEVTGRCCCYNSVSQTALLYRRDKTTWVCVCLRECVHRRKLFSQNKCCRKPKGMQFRLHD